MSNRYLPLFVLLALWLAPLSSWANQGIVTLTLEPGGGTQAALTRLWLPYPISTPFQDITEMHLQGNGRNMAVYGDPENGAVHLFTEWSEEVKKRRLVMRFQVQTREQKVDNLQDAHLPVPVEMEKYLQSTLLIPTDGEVGKQAQQIIAGKTGILEKAQAVYDWVVENTRRDPTVKGCGVGDVEVTLSKRSGKCADLSSVYVALARAAGVPAREIFGLRLSKQAEEEISGGFHCWAEFYLPGTGWIPVDPADVRKIMLMQKLDLEQAKETRQYYFGAVDDHRIVLRQGGRGVTLTPIQQAGPLNYFMYPYAELDGKAVDYYDPKAFRYTIHFKKTDK